jgi:hypothetical protein
VLINNRYTSITLDFKTKSIAFFDPAEQPVSEQLTQQLGQISTALNAFGPWTINVPIMADGAARAAEESAIQILQELHGRLKKERTIDEIHTQVLGWNENDYLIQRNAMALTLKNFKPSEIPPYPVESKWKFWKRIPFLNRSN